MRVSQPFVLFVLSLVSAALAGVEQFAKAHQTANKTLPSHAKHSLKGKAIQKEGHKVKHHDHSSWSATTSLHQNTLGNASSKHGPSKQVLSEWAPKATKSSLLRSAKNSSEHSAKDTNSTPLRSAGNATEEAGDASEEDTKVLQGPWARALVENGATAGANQISNSSQDASANATLQANITYKLRLCNAYAWPVPLEMRRLEEPRIIEYPLPYKECRDYSMPMEDGDQLQFRAGDEVLGTFAVHGLSTPSSLLLLVPHRKDSHTTAIAFQSHMFADSENPQVAVVDAYAGGEGQDTIRIEERVDTRSSRGARSALAPSSEELRFNSVVALTPGLYKLGLGLTTSGVQGPSVSFHAAAKEGVGNVYVAMRVGGGSQTSDGESWPEELIVYPTSNGCRRLGFAMACVLLLFQLFQ